METTKAEHTEPTQSSPKPTNKRGRKPGQLSSKTEKKQQQAENARLRFSKNKRDSDNVDGPKQTIKASPPKKKQKTKAVIDKVVRLTRTTSNPKNDALQAQLDPNQEKLISAMQEKIDVLSDQFNTLTTLVHSLVERMSAAEVELALTRS